MATYWSFLLTYAQDRKNQIESAVECNNLISGAEVEAGLHKDVGSTVSDFLLLDQQESISDTSIAVNGHVGSGS